MIWDGTNTVLGFAVNGGRPVRACSPHISAEQLRQVVPILAFAEGDPERLTFTIRGADDFPVHITAAPYFVLPHPICYTSAHRLLADAAVDGLADGVDNTVAHASQIFGVLQMVERAGRGLPFVGSSAFDVGAYLGLGTVEVFNSIKALCCHRLLYQSHLEMDVEPPHIEGSLFRAHLEGDVSTQWAGPNGRVEYTFRWSASMEPIDLSV